MQKTLMALKISKAIDGCYCGVPAWPGWRRGWRNQGCVAIGYEESI